jgi:L-threonylcarbamoyladenylate synthase
LKRVGWADEDVMTIALRTSGPSVWRVDPRRPAPEVITVVSELLLNGGVVIYPTETVYGLGVFPGDAGAVKRVYAIKGRPVNKPLPIVASGVQAARRAVSRWPKAAEWLSHEFWPGPLTLLVPASPDLSPLIHGSTGKIALRVTSHPVAAKLAAACGGLLVSTSANLSGDPPCTDPSLLSEALLSRVDGVVDAGPATERPSTVVEVLDEVPWIRLLRQGAVPWSAVRRRVEQEFGPVTFGSGPGGVSI